MSTGVTFQASSVQNDSLRYRTTCGNVLLSAVFSNPPHYQHEARDVPLWTISTPTSLQAYYRCGISKHDGDTLPVVFIGARIRDSDRFPLIIPRTGCAEQSKSRNTLRVLPRYLRARTIEEGRERASFSNHRKKALFAKHIIPCLILAQQSSYVHGFLHRRVIIPDGPAQPVNQIGVDECPVALEDISGATPEDDVRAQTPVNLNCVGEVQLDPRMESSLNLWLSGSVLAFANLSSPNAEVLSRSKVGLRWRDERTSFGRPFQREELGGSAGNAVRSLRGFNYQGFNGQPSSSHYELIVLVFLQGKLSGAFGARDWSTWEP
ncbi:hypothetical protein HYDPIDRAFT_189578 [Hydnomerulius pinastri MD-312]|uniref:Uncharacterized protein n=1 Tax=Hydnomerulius pinastri MD-312 TaxID=994086 RepID=A0A0C9VTY5_9AGAM|nr:hypothetical protein HYDPIDRAFT_189578 [Hydnomerulius pinastri MD-312]